MKFWNKNTATSPIIKNIKRNNTAFWSLEHSLSDQIQADQQNLYFCREDVSEEEKVLSDWDPMKDSYEQKSFNSYQEPAYDADVTERHNPVRG